MSIQSLNHRRHAHPHADRTLTHTSAIIHSMIQRVDGMNDAVHMHRPPRQCPPSATDSP